MAIFKPAVFVTVVLCSLAITAGAHDGPVAGAKKSVKQVVPQVQPAAVPQTGDVVLPSPDVLPSGYASAKSPTTADEHSRYSVLMDVSSGKILWSRNPDAHREIASTTKILTAILLLERGKLNDLVTAPAGIEKVEESSLHLKTGETIPLHDLLYAMMLRSANDTAVAGAYYLSGSIPAFAAEMNKKARDIGALHSNFVTPNGLYDPMHYSTAADMALIARYAVLNLPEFNKIVSTQRYKVQRSMEKNDCWVKNTSSKFLKEFPGGDGIKTGYISQAGHCFVGSATRYGWRMIAVALNSDSCREDVESILNFGFNNFERVRMMHKDDAAGTIDLPGAATPAPVQAAADAVTAVSRWQSLPRFSYRLTPLPNLPMAPIAAGVKLGTITIMANGAAQATIDAVSSQPVAAKPIVAAVHVVKSAGNTILTVLLNIVGALALIIIGGRLYARTVAKGSGGSRDRVASPVRRAD